MKEITTLRTVLSHCKPFFVYGAIFTFIDKLLGLGGAFYMMAVFDRVLTSRSNETLLMLTIIFTYIQVIEAIVNRYQTRIFDRLGDIVFVKLRDKVVTALLNYRQLTDRNSTRGLEDLETVKAFVSGAGFKAAFEIPWIPLFLAILFLFHPLLCLVAVVGAVIIAGMTWLEEVITKQEQAEVVAKEREAKGFLDQSMRNAEAVDALGMIDHVEKRWMKLSDEHQSLALSARQKVGVIVAWSRFILGLKSVVSIGLAAYLVLNVEGVSPGIMIASTMIMAKAMTPIMVVLSSWRGFLDYRGASDRLNELLSDERLNREGFKPPDPNGCVSVESLLYFIDRDRTILNGINFRLEPGEALGVVGNSAAGKTTLLRLLVGIIKPSDGHVRLDGADVYQWAANGLGRWLGYVPQQQQLFEGTVAENIARMGDANANAMEVIEAANRAGIHDMILRLPKGYDTEVGLAGKNLSGGQRQLVSIARALYGNPRVVIMDEPNASLDGQSEALLLDLIKTLRDEKVTQIIVSHKPSVLQDVDRIMVLGKSKQLMLGSREEIMARLNPATLDIVEDNSQPLISRSVG